MRKAGAAILSCCLLAGSLAACSQPADKPARQAAGIEPAVYDQTYTDDTFRVYYSDGKYELLLQATTLNVGVRDIASGQVWYASPVDGNYDGYGATVADQLRSQVLIEYYDTANQMFTMNIMLIWTPCSVSVITY